MVNNMIGDGLDDLLIDEAVLVKIDEIELLKLVFTFHVRGVGCAKVDDDTIVLRQWCETDDLAVRR